MIGKKYVRDSLGQCGQKGLVDVTRNRVFKTEVWLEKLNFWLLQPKFDTDLNIRDRYKNYVSFDSMSKEAKNTPNPALKNISLKKFQDDLNTSEIIVW